MNKSNKKNKKIKTKLGEQSIAEFNYNNEIKPEDPLRPDYPFKDQINSQPEEKEPGDNQEEIKKKIYGI